MKRRSHPDSALYARSFLLTMGALMSGLAGFVILSMWTSTEVVSAGLWIGMIGVGLVGIGLLLAGLVVRDAAIERVANVATAHEASIIAMVLAFPLYILLKQMRRSKR